MTELTSNSINCRVYYRPGLFDHDVERLENIHREIIYFKNPEHYIKQFIDYIKHNVIKQYPDLSLIKIQLSILDNGNIWHRLFVTVANMLNVIGKQKIHSFSFNKYVFVNITYEQNIVFMGGLDFTNI
jgi:hypothetical protein